MSDFGIYIHWPFCKSKCPYCDFFSRVRKDIDQDAIVDSYIEDIAFYAQKTGPRSVTSIFFGGGTPSLLSPQNVERLIAAVARNWRLAPDAEISLEANPNTRSNTLFADLRRAGVNRLSLGVQSLDNAELRFLGRTHTAAQAMQSLEDVLKNFDNHSADFIYALPQQSLQGWDQSLRQILGLGLKHLSLYQLTVEENTVFSKKGVRPLNEEEAAQIYLSTEEVLQKGGYRHYEISNYAQPGAECRHNLVYWHGGDYVGIGEGAHGRLRIGGRFFATTHRCRSEELSAAERAEELLLMGLRLREGIDKQRFYRCCGLEFDAFVNAEAVKELVSDGFLTDTPQSLQITPQGLLVSDKIIEELL